MQLGNEVRAAITAALTAADAKSPLAIRLAQAGEWGLADAMELDWLNGPTGTVEPIFAGEEDAFALFDVELTEQMRAVALRRTDAGLVVTWVGTCGGADLRRCRHYDDPAGQLACRRCRGTGYWASDPAAAAAGLVPEVEMMVLETDIDGRILAVLGVE